MKKKIFLMGNFFALVFFWLMTGSAMGIGTYDGNWDGTNNQGYDLSFEVTNDVVRHLLLRHHNENFFWKLQHYRQQFYNFRSDL